MKNSRSRKLWVWCATACISILGFSSAYGADLANKKKIITRAHHAYYNLRNEGLAEFTCSVTPDWNALLEDVRKTDPAGADRAVTTLSRLHFTVNLGRDGKVQITHNDLPGESKQMMDALHQIYGGMEQMTSGFFDTWSLFMLNKPFPAVDSEYQLEALGPQYRLSYKEGETNVVTTMSREFAIDALNVTTAVFASSIRPQLTRTSKGLLFSGYEADYQSNVPGETTHLKVQIDYQDVSGLQLLRKLGLSGTYGGSPFSIALTFSGCQATKSTP